MKICHHNLISVKFVFNIPSPPSFYRDICNYKSINVEMIQKAKIGFNCKWAFSNNSVNKNVSQTLKNILSNYIPNRRIKNWWEDSKNLDSFEEKAKVRKKTEKYINELSKKLSNPETAPKTNWKILNLFLSNKKIPSIPPLLVNVEMISNFSKKAEFF